MYRRDRQQPDSLANIELLNACWSAPAMLVEGINVEDIFELVSLVLFLIISWTFWILAHDEDQYSYVYKMTKNFKMFKMTIES